jgi:AcrR family transcriptional regulator
MADTVSKKNPVHTRRDEEKEMRRQDILDAAERVIAQHGWDGADFGKVAQRARLSRSLVYFYFPKREDLFHAVCERGLMDLEKRFATVMTTRRKGLDQTMDLGQAYHAFAREQPLYFNLIAQFQGKELDPLCQSDTEGAANARGERCVGTLVQAMANGIKDGSIRKTIGDPRPAAVALWAFTHGLIQIASRREAMLKENFHLNTAQMVEHGFRLLRDALAAEE